MMEFCGRAAGQGPETADAAETGCWTGWRGAAAANWWRSFSDPAPLILHWFEVADLSEFRKDLYFICF